MKERERGFLAPDKLPADVFDYVRELHELLWRVARVAYPGASGDLTDLIEGAIERLEKHRTEAGPSIEAINSARYVMYHARDFGEHEAILANEIMRLDVNKQQDK